MADISNFTTTKILGKRPSPSGVDYWCELDLLWLLSQLVEKTQMEDVQVQIYVMVLRSGGKLAG